MILYHFRTSTFAHRVRLILAMKGLSAELRDPRVDATLWPELRAHNPLRTVPTLVDGDRVFTDSLTIAAYLEGKVPPPSIWPRGDLVADALEYVRLADRAIDILVELGMRFHALAAHPSWPEIKGEKLSRAQGALDRIGQRVEARGAAEYLVSDRRTIADIAVVTAVLWLQGLPVRAPNHPPAQQVLDLGWKLPAALANWAEPRLTRPDVALLL